VGIVYFTAAFIAEEPLEKVGVALIPFMLVEVVVMFLILYFPSLTLWLPRWRSSYEHENGESGPRTLSSASTQFWRRACASYAGRCWC